MGGWISMLSYYDFISNIFSYYLLSSPIYFTLILYSRSWCSLTWEWVVTINCTILVSLVEVDGWLNFMLSYYDFIYNIFSYYLLSSPIYFSHFNSLFTILVLFNLRMGGYNCTILASLVEVDGWLNIHAFLLRFLLHICILYYLLYPSVILSLKFFIHDPGAL